MNVRTSRGVKPLPQVQATRSQAWRTGLHQPTCRTFLMSSAPNLMVEAMRWFGPADPVSLSEIRQTGATAVFSALHEIPYGEAWPADQIAQRQAEIAAAGLT